MADHRVPYKKYFRESDVPVPRKTLKRHNVASNIQLGPGINNSNDETDQLKYSASNSIQFEIREESDNNLPIEVDDRCTAVPLKELSENEPPPTSELIKGFVANAEMHDCIQEVLEHDEGINANGTFNNKFRTLEDFMQSKEFFEPIDIPMDKTRGELFLMLL
ncbi:uncharacterized protein LOC116416557 [Nasonia vitripennis]|uniref:Uncharacterized protein n=1 Tax=Nasonia vitripennis TaxID=7425 RepID=A0A7M7Q7Y6_NASVI|nr:uncharacterized protein LOC116416557 [Nasonia vitripennis]